MNLGIPRPSQEEILRYRVRTLYGLAHDIVREKPGRVGLDERWDNDMLHLLDVLTGNDFEAVETSALMVYPDSGEVK